jgi:hypothetical protein
MPTLHYSFGDADHPTETYSGTADVDVDGDGAPDGIALDFDGSGHRDAIAWDSDGDGTVDTILVSSHHDGVYDTAYYDPSGNGSWNTAESIDTTVGHPQDDPAATAPAAPPAAGGTELSYSFGDAHHPTETYSGAADVDVNGDGRADGLRLDFDGSGHRDAIAWDSDGDGKVDTILVSSHHDGHYDTAYHDPSGDGHWNEAHPITGPVTSAGIDHADPVPAPDPAPEPEPVPVPDPLDDGGGATDNAGYVVGSDDDPYAHLALIDPP